MDALIVNAARVTDAESPLVRLPPPVRAERVVSGATAKEQPEKEQAENLSSIWNRPIWNRNNLAGPWLAATFILSCLLGLALTGCRTFSQRGPVPEAVATCRQLSQQGVVAMENGQWEQAEILLSQAVAACDTNEEARRRYAEILWHRGENGQALEQMDRALKLNGGDATLHCKMGEMCLQLREWQRAENHATRALQLDGQSASAWALRGKIHHARGESPQALADMQRAMRYAPEEASILLAVAELQREAAQPQRALVTLWALADLYPPGEEPRQVLYLTGLALSAVGRHADAAEQLYAASQRDQPSAEILYRLAEAELLSGRAEAAEANALQALQLNPQHAACHGLVERLASARAERVAGRHY